MTLTGATQRLSAADGELLVRTGRDGPAAAVGHDLTLRAERWAATLTIDARAPARSRVRARVDASSLRVVEARGGALPLTDAQRAQVEATIREVLEAARHRSISFVSTAVAGTARRATVSGDLTIHGQTAPVHLVVRAGRRAGQPVLSARVSLSQREFGITPYATMLGALRVADQLDVDIRLRIPQAPSAAPDPPPGHAHRPRPR